MGDACQQWIWTELIGFDNRESDFGVGGYLDGTGFVPDTICLLLSSVDFVLQHPGMAEEVVLPTDVCSREGHDRNQHRERQTWTNFQIRGLIEALHARGVAVYVTVFTQTFDDRWHHEWATDHPEACALYASGGIRWSINPLARLRDGTYFEDLFAWRLAAVAQDYGFDGWQGADGYGPLSGPIWEVDQSDDMVVQFLESGGDLPDTVALRCDNDPEALKARAAWIWRHRRQEWIDFYAGRWARFWRKMVMALHASGRKVVVNSAWGRAPFEALYRYGIDYRRLAEAGVDGIIVESVAASLALDPRAGDPARHYEFLAMLLLMKAYVPETPLIPLNVVHDIVEQWDVLRHAPAVLEKEIHAPADVYLSGPEGRLSRCADGFLACLGDGLEPEEWAWLRRRWQAAFGARPRRVLGATLVWSDTAFRAQVGDFIATRRWSTHRLLYHLMAFGAPVQAAARVDDLDGLTGPLLVLNSHLFPADEMEQIQSYAGGPVFAIGSDVASRHADGASHGRLCCRIFGADGMRSFHAEDACAEVLPEDLLGIPEPRGYWDYLTFRSVPETFLWDCAQALLETTGIAIRSDAERVTLMATELRDGSLRIALKNKSGTYAKPQVGVGREIGEVRVVTEFPLVSIRPEGSTFSVRVPPGGIVVLDVIERS